MYKPEADRLWGYYVLPVFYRGRFVGRFDSRLVGGIWHIMRWWWETDAVLDAQLLDSVGTAAQRFAEYLGAQGARVGERVDASMRDVLQLHLG